MADKEKQEARPEELSWQEKLQIRAQNGLDTALKYLTWGGIGSAAAGTGMAYAALSGGALAAVVKTVTLGATLVVAGVPSLAGIATVAGVGAAVTGGLGLLKGFVSADDKIRQAKAEKRQEAMNRHLDMMREHQQSALARQQTQEVNAMEAAQLKALGLQAHPQPQAVAYNGAQGAAPPWPISNGTGRGT